MSEKLSISVAKHLEDENDLSKNRDAGLVPGQEQLAFSMAEAIHEHAISNKFRILLFYVSPKKRALETAELVKKCLADKTDKLRIILKVDTNLREIDQGRFILPESYQTGDHFPGLKIAGQIFSAETFNSENPANDNLNYHFGDPLLQTDGTYKYPELLQYFSERGESYRDILLRFYGEVIKFSGSLERLKDKVDPVIFTHGQPHQIFLNLSQVAEKVEKEGFNVEVGKLPRICWDLYQTTRLGVIPFGQLTFISIENVCKPKMVDILKREITHLKGI
ncbi:MAG: hypothetical protein M3M85_01095 [bacterium]|nr:hypothetical protein [bacterium]